MIKKKSKPFFFFLSVEEIWLRVSVCTIYQYKYSVPQKEKLVRVATMITMRSLYSVILQRPLEDSRSYNRLNHLIPVLVAALTYAMQDSCNSPPRKLLITSMGEEAPDVSSDLILPVQQLQTQKYLKKFKTISR